MADTIRRARLPIKKNRTNRRALSISVQGIKDSMLVLKYVIYQRKRCSSARRKGRERIARKRTAKMNNIYFSISIYMNVYTNIKLHTSPQGIMYSSLVGGEHSK
jgi:hypothetical protein